MQRRKRWPSRNPEIVADHLPIAGDSLAIGGELVIVVIAGKGKDAAGTGPPGHPREVHSFLHLIL
jgi:hypothetical protein